MYVLVCECVHLCGVCCLVPLTVTFPNVTTVLCVCVCECVCALVVCVCLKGGGSGRQVLVCEWPCVSVFWYVCEWVHLCGVCSLVPFTVTFPDVTTVLHTP